MNNKPKGRKATSPHKADDFVSVAQRLGADEDKALFEAKLRRIAKSKLHETNARRK